MEAALIGAMRGLFPAGVGVGFCRIGTAPPPWPDENAPRAVPARLAEFAAGRAAARAALADAGLPPASIPMGADRAPIWPAGVFGSITHTEGVALAVAGRAPLGLDAEPDADLPEDLIALVAPGHDARAARLIFAAKEAAYKCQYPITRQLLDFDALEISVAGESLTARLITAAPPLPQGTQLQGRFTRAAGLLLAGFMIGAANARG